jgi:hypothetical protein
MTLNEANPSTTIGLPPSSLHSFLSARNNLTHVFVSNHEKAYTNPYYGSIMDTGLKYRNDSAALVDALCGVVDALAKSAYQLAMAGSVGSAAAVSIPGTLSTNCTMVYSIGYSRLTVTGCGVVGMLGV